MWKNQLTRTIHFISSKDNDEERVMHSKSDNIEIVINDITNKVMKNFVNHFLIDIKLDWKHQREVVILSLIVFIYCIINFIK